MDCKHNYHSNKNMCKGNNLINHGRSKSKPKKLQQSHIINHGNNRLIDHSPKTIDYSNGNHMQLLIHLYSNEKILAFKFEIK